MIRTTKGRKLDLQILFCEFHTYLVYIPLMLLLGIQYIFSYRVGVCYTAQSPVDEESK